MNKKYSKLLKPALLAVILVTASLTFNNVFELNRFNNVSQTASWFGVGDDHFEPVKAVTAEDALASKIKWAILVFAILVILVLSYVFDISALASKLSGKKIINSDKVNGKIMLLFLIFGMAGVAWEFMVHGKHALLSNASSEHGAIYDSMFNVTLILTMIVFVITQVALFWFGFKYASSPERKAIYYAHNNKLEIFWTLIPAVVLTFLVLKGHQTWRAITYGNDSSKAQQIEIFAFQFGWKARYAGADGQLGSADYKYISGPNPLGLAVREEVDALLIELDSAIIRDNNALKTLDVKLQGLKKDLIDYTDKADRTNIEATAKEIEKIKSGEAQKELEASIKRKTKQIERIKAIENDKKLSVAMFNNAANDDIIASEIHMIENKPVNFRFRSRDIIHSAYMPYFRVQMNVVPGMLTQFTFTPTKTTAKIREEKGDKTFDYYLYCNKICGTSHYNMKIKVVVESENEYNAWMKSQKPAFMKQLPEPAIPAVDLKDSTQMMKADSAKNTKLVAIR